MAPIFEFVHHNAVKIGIFQILGFRKSLSRFKYS